MLKIITALKNIKIKYSNYLVFNFCFLSIIFTPILFEFIFNLSNTNNSDYINNIHIKHYVKIFFSVLFFSGLITLPFLLMNRFWKKLFLIILSLTFFLTSFIDFIHVMIFQFRTNPSSWYSIFSTNKNETFEFINDYFSIYLILAIIIFILIPIFFYFISTKFQTWKYWKMLFISYLICFAFSIFFIVKRSEFSYINEISFFNFQNSYSEYNDEIRILQNVKKQNLFVTNISQNNNNTHIIIVGESTSKYHMQLYGYKRKTNPKLEKIKDKLIIFNHVKANYAHTIASLQEALFIKEKYSLIDLFNSGGAKTYWLSNQKYLGENETAISSMANNADEKIFINPIGKNKFDGELLLEFEKILNENASEKVIFIHLIGTHLSYQDRYPTNFNHFKTKNISPFGDHADSFINHYDNAVLYNDFVISEIIKRCDNLKNNCSVVYFSDHGDEVYDFRDFHGHSQVLLSKYMTDIPFIVFLNKSLKESMQKTSNINTEKEFSLKEFSNTIQDLYGYESEYYDKTKSLFYNDSLTKKNENLDSKLSINPNTNTFPKLKSKIWAHRVNSIKRFNFLQNKFSGVELDIVYENNKLYVRHPPAESDGLTLDLFLKNIKNINEYYFWLDLKNLSSENEKNIIQILNILAKKYKNKANIFLESADAELIPELINAGFYTSYYLPNLTNLNNTEMQKEIIKIQSKITKYNISTISQNIDNYNLMREYFPNLNKQIWALNFEWNDEKNHERIFNLLKEDSSIKICLVNYTTEGWK